MDKKDDAYSLAGPDDQSGRVRTSLSVRAENLFSRFSDFKSRQQKLALVSRGCQHADKEHQTVPVCS
jgi:hypothetical protein